MKSCAILINSGKFALKWAEIWGSLMRTPPPQNVQACIYIIYPCDILKILRRFVITTPTPKFGEDKQQNTPDKIYNFYQVCHIFYFQGGASEIVYNLVV